MPMTITKFIICLFFVLAMCDFQYLAVHREGSSDGPISCALEKVIPSGVDVIDYML